MTGNVSLVRHIYKVERVKKNYSVYQLVRVEEVNKEVYLIPKSEESEAIKRGTRYSRLTDLIRIEKFRMFSHGSGFNDYLRLKNTTNWQTSEQVTGLFKTQNPGVFYGDRRHSGCRNLIVFVFTDNREQLTIDYYIGFDPNKAELTAILNRCTKG